jgi:hypothetical protein
MLFMYLKHVITAGILSAALAIGPGAAFAQTSGSTSGTSGTSTHGSTTQGTSSGTTSQGTGSQASPSGTSSASSTASRQAGSGGSGADQEAVRQHLSAAREALAELTKLPAASQLQGEQRQQVAQLISDFNAFATATTDWRPKYDTIDRELDQILGLNGSTGTAGSATGSASTTGASGSAGASTGTTADASTAGASGSASGAVGTTGSGAAGGALDPSIIAKLREVRTHLDGFEEASGDPTFVVEKIEKILDQASGGASAGGAVGTSGSTSDSSASAGGSVTLTAAQVQELRRQLDTIKAAAKR